MLLAKFVQVTCFTFFPLLTNYMTVIQFIEEYFFPCYDTAYILIILLAVQSSQSTSLDFRSVINKDEQSSTAVCNKS